MSSKIRPPGVALIASSAPAVLNFSLHLDSQHKRGRAMGRSGEIGSFSNADVQVSKEDSTL